MQTSSSPYSKDVKRTIEGLRNVGPNSDVVVKDAKTGEILGYQDHNGNWIKQEAKSG